MRLSEAPLRRGFFSWMGGKWVQVGFGGHGGDKAGLNLHAAKRCAPDCHLT